MLNLDREKMYRSIANRQAEVIAGFENNITRLKELEEHLDQSTNWPDDSFSEGMVVGLRIALLIFGRLGK